MASKFDNRLKEFAERWEVDKYLSATGLQQSCRGLPAPVLMHINTRLCD